MEREVDATKPMPGAGQGWRLATGAWFWFLRTGQVLRHRTYRVVEPGPIDVPHLIAESDAVARRLGCTCPSTGTPP